MGSVHVYTPEQTVDLPFTLFCKHPRRLYPGESRPWDSGGFFWHRLGVRKWWTDASYSAGMLSITTTGTHSLTIDVPALLGSVRQGATAADALEQASVLRLNRAMIARWSVPTLLVTAALLTLVLYTAGALRRMPAWRHRLREGQNVCAQCGYSLRGLAEPRCPECGETFEPAVSATAKPPRPARWRPPYGVIIGAVAGVAAYVGLYALRIQALWRTNFAGDMGKLRYGTRTVAPLYTKWWCSDFFLAALAILAAVLVHQFVVFRSARRSGR